MDDLDAGWDDEVDVVCTDAGLAGLATAIVTVDAGGSVFVARQPAPPEPADWFTVDSGDPDTAHYLRELTADIELETLPRSTVDLPVRLVREPEPMPGRRIRTFDGSLLRDWAMQCVPARSGYLYSRVAGWDASALESADGDALAVAEVGSMAPDSADVGGSVLRWLDSLAGETGVDPEPVTSLERLVFDEGVVTGAVFAIGDDRLSIRARHGVLVCRAGGAARAGGDHGLATGAPLRVALVGKVASRFGRVELLTSDPEVLAEYRWR
ncbi:MAG: hypothetical protein SW019_03415 [Actinomycetota bacterium]|nr:hypothetical protein [Actinomycetota bacterium]